MKTFVPLGNNNAFGVQFFWWEIEILKLGSNSPCGYSLKAGPLFKISPIILEKGKTWRYFRNFITTRNGSYHVTLHFSLTCSPRFWNQSRIFSSHQRSFSSLLPPNVAPFLEPSVSSIVFMQRIMIPWHRHGCMDSVHLTNV